MASKSNSVIDAANEYFDSLIKSRFIEMFSQYFNSNEVTLTDLCTSIESGKSFNCWDSRNGIEPAILKLGAVLGGVYNPDENKVVDSNLFRKELEVRTGDVLFSRKNTYELVGTAAYVWDTPPNLMLPDLIFRINLKDDVNPIYFVNLINHPQFRIRVTSLAHGAASSMPNISKKELLNLSIPVPPINEQSQFADFVRQVDKSKLDFQKLVSEFDELIKSRFVEMFGDPSNNTKWESKQLKEISSKIGSGATPKGGKSSYAGTDIAFIRSMNVHDCLFVYDDLALITEEQADKLANVTVEPEDILFNITGASVARCCIVPDDVLPARVNQHVSIIRLDKNVMNPIFFNTMIVSNSMKRMLLNDSKSNGATREAITKEMLSSLEIIIPPIELQDQFTDFVKQVDKSKSEILEGVKKLKIQ